jgi:hypothetical protein
MIKGSECRKERKTGNRFTSSGVVIITCFLLTGTTACIMLSQQEYYIWKAENWKAENGDLPYPASSVISSITIQEHMKMTPDRAGDNWPITWADDGHQYSAWGDGRGPNHPDDERISLGFVRVEGDPPDVEVYKIDSDGERSGDGRSGQKASGMLMVEGVLYMWVRNADRDGQKCQLAWSTDYAGTWAWSDWKFDEFGYCTFLNFGQNYQGARDEYVYMYSHDHPSAYLYADDFILTRVPKDRIAERNAYEFYTGMNNDGDPLWSSDISDRGSVFHHEGRAQRSGISYNAVIDRYLWWQAGYPNPDDGLDSRFNDGPLGIYEAPEPWGPWRTVLYTEEFPGGPGENGSFPPKWMEPISNGRQKVYMVSSRDDVFAVWPVIFTVDLDTGN